jgi:hypothetical protein
MVALAVTLIAFPDAMNSLTGAMAVFGAAVVIALVMWVMDRMVRRRHEAQEAPAPAMSGKR